MHTGATTEIPFEHHCWNNLHNYIHTLYMHGQYSWLENADIGSLHSICSFKALISVLHFLLIYSDANTLLLI